MTALRLTRVAVWLVVLAVLLWSVCYGWLYLFGDERSTPPRWRIPPVPDGVAVLDEGMVCGSGGCWWGLTLEPPAGQSPEDLRRQLGLESERKLPPTLTDRGFVVTGADIRQGHMVVHVGYA